MGVFDEEVVVGVDGDLLVVGWFFNVVVGDLDLVVFLVEVCCVVGNVYGYEGGYVVDVEVGVGDGGFGCFGVLGELEVGVCEVIDVGVDVLYV